MRFTVMVGSARSVKTVDDDLYNKHSIQEEDGQVRWKITQHKENKDANGQNFHSRENQSL